MSTPRNRTAYNQPLGTRERARLSALTVNELRAFIASLPPHSLRAREARVIHRDRLDQIVRLVPRKVLRK